jgi:glutamine cyclotransferase
MAKVFYVVENAPDYSQVNFYKTEKEALKFGLSQIPNFEMGEEPMNDEENDGEEFFHGAELTFDKGILYTVDYGEIEVEAIDEDAAREKVQQNEDAVAIFFDGFTKGMYGYQGTAADGKGYKWDWDGYDINESNKINIKHTMKHIKLFEQFSKSLNEGISSSDKKKLEEFAAQVSEEIIDANNHNRKFDEDEYSEEAMYNIFLDMVADYDSVDEFIDEYDWRGFTMELGL